MAPKKLGSFKARWRSESGEAAEVIIKVVLVCAAYYGFIGVYDFIQEVKQDRMNQQHLSTPAVKRPKGF